MTSPNLEKLFSELLHDINRPFANLDMFLRLMAKRCGGSDLFEEGSSEIIAQSSHVKGRIELIQKYFSTRKSHPTKGRLYLDRALNELKIEGSVFGESRSIPSIVVDSFRMFCLGLREEGKLDNIRIELMSSGISFLFNGTDIARSDIKEYYQLELKRGTYFAVFNKYLTDHNIEHSLLDHQNGLELMIHGH